MIVVDASVAVKWLLPEEDDATAGELLTCGDELVGPALLRVEVASAIARKVRFDEIGLKEGETALELWLQSLLDGVVTLVPDGADLPRAWKIAAALRHPLQDCLYLALAIRLGARMVTADEKFAVKARPTHAGVRVLGERV